jgi:hypothetical protein
VHPDAADVVVAQFDLAGVQARAELQADPCQLIAQGGRALVDQRRNRWSPARRRGGP